MGERKATVGAGNECKISKKHMKEIDEKLIVSSKLNGNLL